MKKTSTKVPVWLIVLGVCFLVNWLGSAFVLGAMKLMAGVIANDSGSACTDAHLGLIVAVMGGQAILSAEKRQSSEASFSPCWSVACSS